MIHFLSDLHLSPQSPGATALLLRYLNGVGREAEAIYVLGDLFEAWIGDDDLADPYNATITEALRLCTEGTTKVFVMHGNRDFLLGETFAAAARITLLPDPHVLSLVDRQFVLSHGDALCTDDLEYVAFRRQVRRPEWQAQFLAKPLAERKGIALQMRQRSEQEKFRKADYLMDVNLYETEDFLRQQGYANMIHGHTHRPARHDHIVDGIHVERWVLADWREDRGEYLAWDGDTLTRQAVV